MPLSDKLIYKLHLSIGFGASKKGIGQVQLKRFPLSYTLGQCIAHKLNILKARQIQLHKKTSILDESSSDLQVVTSAVGTNSYRKSLSLCRE